jgi:inorganic pyrophosphatase/exopolyphosphatase
MDSIVKMVQKLFKMKKWAEWDITVDSTPQSLESRRLAAPELIHKEGADKHLYCNERLLKQMPVFSADELSKKTLFLVFDRRNEQI